MSGNTPAQSVMAAAVYVCVCLSVRMYVSSPAPVIPQSLLDDVMSKIKEGTCR